MVLLLAWALDELAMSGVDGAEGVAEDDGESRWNNRSELLAPGTRSLK